LIFHFEPPAELKVGRFMHALNPTAKNVPEKVYDDFQWKIKMLGDKNFEG